MQIIPFAGMFYNKATVDIQDVVSPPWDVISKDSSYSKYNIVNIDLHKDKQLFDQLIADDVLITDDKPAIYVYAQEYTWDGVRRQRSGFVALTRLENYSKNTIMPHEKIIYSHIQNRVDALKTLKANFSPVFALHEGTIDIETSGEPMFEVEHEGVVNKLWPVYDEAVIERVQKDVAARQLYVADGHHRYGSGLKYKEESHDAKYVMMFFAPMDETLTILPAHRVLDARIDMDRVKAVFDVADAQSDYHASSSIVMYCDGVYHTLTAKNKESLSDIIDLHSMLSGLDDKLSYVKDMDDALSRTDAVNGTAFLVNAVTPDEIVRVCNAGEIFPQKATYFYPKILSGLVMYKF
ncbi:MAG: DUF1015 domain-containing protein [Chloroflexi bacterium]|nr:DUF1015 domain-containing protein [Chloroflexota bacterium]MBT7080673.1 DUF1015 domain-containing protein [Chloroflexota bacterium]MBT7290250.1 DUF1015 domain-containing protein [Chloroflexota bacterium]